MKTRTLTVLVVTFLILVAIGGASYYLAPQTPSPTPTPKPTLTPTFTPFSTPTSTPLPSLTPKPTPTPTPKPTPSSTLTPMLTATPTPTPTHTTTPTPTPEQTETKVNCTVYFTPDGQVLDRLIESIDRAQRYVYAAFYDLDLEDIAEALIDAKARGVDVKVVVDSDNMDNPAVNMLLNAGVVVGDRDPDFMHNKFMVIDDKIVWTGSMNPTYNGVYRNDNNVVVISGLPELVEDFKREFEELWNGIYGGGAPVPYPEITVNSTFSLEIYFAPEDGVEDQIIEELASAEKAVYFAIFTFTSKPIANTLIDRHEEGVTVNGIYEAFQAGGYSTYSLLEAHGIAVVKDGNPAVMHHKFFVIDNYTVITGSFNPTRHANEANDENIVIIHSRLVAERFAVQFKKMWRKWYTSKPNPTPTTGVKISITYVHYDAEGNDNQNLNDEYVVIKNEGETAVDLTGWTLRDEAGHIYTFPRFTLEAGATVTVHTGSGVNTKTHLYWGRDRAVWNNDHDTAYLYDANGTLVDKKSW